LRLVVRFDFEAFLLGDGKRFISVRKYYDNIWEVYTPTLPNEGKHGYETYKLINIGEITKDMLRSLHGRSLFSTTVVINERLCNHILINGIGLDEDWSHYARDEYERVLDKVYKEFIRKVNQEYESASGCRERIYYRFGIKK
jgi:hypothetical protein